MDIDRQMTSLPDTIARLRAFKDTEIRAKCDVDQGEPVFIIDVKQYHEIFDALRDSDATIDALVARLEVAREQAESIYKGTFVKEGYVGVYTQSINYVGIRDAAGEILAATDLTANQKQEE